MLIVKDDFSDTKIYIHKHFPKKDIIFLRSKIQNRHKILFFLAYIIPILKPVSWKIFRWSY